jgi:TM2 domain-containing membrane protein YozV
MSTTVPPAGLNDASAMMRYDANKKSAGIAYLLWFFLGGLGVHRFYLGRTGSGAAMLALWVVSLLLTVVAVGVLGFLVIAVWWVVDAFLVPGIVRDYNNRLIATMGR